MTTMVTVTGHDSDHNDHDTVLLLLQLIFLLLRHPLLLLLLLLLVLLLLLPLLLPPLMFEEVLPALGASRASWRRALDEWRGRHARWHGLTTLDLGIGKVVMRLGEQAGRAML